MGVGGVAGVLGLVNIPSKQKPPHIQHTVDTRAANAPSVFTITEKAKHNNHKGRAPLRIYANQPQSQFHVYLLWVITRSA